MYKEGVTLPGGSQAPDNRRNAPDEPGAPKEQLGDQNDHLDQDNTPHQKDSDVLSDTQLRRNTIGDKVKSETVKVAVVASGPGAARNAETAGDKFFDSLPIEKKKARAEDGAAGNTNIKAQIETLRSGNLYQAVIVARLLEKNKKNPMAASAEGRFSRFLDSSALDVASDINTIAGAGIGLLTTFDTDSTSKTVFQGMSLVTNLLTIVSTCRNMASKIRKIDDSVKKHKAGEKISKIDTILTFLGIAGDMLTMMVKGVAIIKTIMSMAGKNNRIMNMISNAMFLLTGATQIIGALNGVRGIQTGFKNLSGLKQDVEKPRKAAMRVVERKKKLTVGQTNSWSEGERIKAAKEILSDEQLTEKEKDDLILYLGLTKRITKAERALAVSAVSLINLTVGFLSTGVSGANTIVNGREVKNKTLKDATTGMGAVANVSNMLTASAKVGNKAVDAAGGSTKKFIKQSLWGKVKELTKDYRGLKWLDESLAKPPGDREKAGENTVDKVAQDTYKLYQTTENQFKSLGVPYAKLIRANSLSKFQDMLVEGL